MIVQACGEEAFSLPLAIRAICISFCKLFKTICKLGRSWKVMVVDCCRKVKFQLDQGM